MVAVAPNHLDYDLKTAAAVYLLTRREEHAVFLKRIQLVRRPAF